MKDTKGHDNRTVLSTTMIFGEPTTVRSRLDLGLRTVQRAGLENVVLLFPSHTAPGKAFASASDPEAGGAVSDAGARQEWEQAVEDWRTKHPEAPPVHLLWNPHYVPGSPSTLHLLIAQQYAFDVLRAETFAYVDPHVAGREAPASEGLVDSLAAILRKGQAADLVLWDYRVAGCPGCTTQRDVDFKATIEEEVKRLLLGSFPWLLSNWDLFGRMSRVRSEVYCMSRTLYQRMREFTPMPSDSGLLALLVARLYDFQVETEEGAELVERKQYSCAKRLVQLRRVAAQLEQAKPEIERANDELWEVDNPKVETRKPTWKPFAGFSYLFDNPGGPRQFLADPDTNVEWVNCQQDAPELQLYTKLWQFVNQECREQLIERHCLCPLPLHSIHLTFWDGVNKENLQELTEEAQSEFEKTLRRLPGSLCAAANTPGGVLPPAKLVVAEWPGPVSFRFKRFAVFPKAGAFVARLVPADDVSEQRLGALLQQRDRLDEGWKAQWGKPRNPVFKPHVSIGYFGNLKLGASSTRLVEALSRRASQQLVNVSITFESISLYGFKNMAGFCRAR